MRDSRPVTAADSRIVSGPAELAEHPGSGECPIPVGHAGRKAEHLTRSFKGKPGKDMQFNEFRGPWVASRQLIEHLVNGEDVRILSAADEVFGERNPDL